MDFGIRGLLRVSSGNGVVDPGAPAQRTLLAVLLTAPGTPVSDDRLVDELWGDGPPPSAHHLLQVYVSRLRTLLGERAEERRIAREGAGYAIRVGPGELDSERFTAAVAEARPLAGRDPAAADRVLQLGPCGCGGGRRSPMSRIPAGYSVHAAHLEQLHREALGTWVRVGLGLGAIASWSSTRPARGAAALRRGNPRPARCGAVSSRRQAEALAAARALEARLRDDLGIDPSPEVRHLYRDILLQAPHLALGPPEPPGNLPNRLTSFVGRARELGTWRSSRQQPPVTLTGPGGIGKTRLALEVPGSSGPVRRDLVGRPRNRDGAGDRARPGGGRHRIAPMPGRQLLEAVARALDGGPPCS